VVADFASREFEGLSGFVRIGTGSMGGKGRGLGFVNALLAREQTGEDGVRIFVPPAAVIGTDVFDEFIAQAELSALALSDASDETIDEAFLRSPLPAALEQDLLAIVERTRGPLAVRSSSRSRTPTTSRSPAFTARLCSRTPIPTCGCGSASWRRR
jgi:hypothetical protein